MGTKKDIKKLFINKTTYTPEVYSNFLEFHNKTYNFSYILYTVFWTILLLFCIILAFGSSLRLQGVIISGILVCFIIYRIVRPKLIVNNELKSDKFSENNINTFTFYDKEFHISNKNGSFNYKYILIRKVFETSDYFYLYVSKENAFLVDKNTFSLGNSEDFGKFIKSKCRYKKI